MAVVNSSRKSWEDPGPTPSGHHPGLDGGRAAALAGSLAPLGFEVTRIPQGQPSLSASRTRDPLCSLAKRR